MTEKRPRSICPGGIEPAESAAGLMKRMVEQQRAQLEQMMQQQADDASLLAKASAEMSTREITVHEAVIATPQVFSPKSRSSSTKRDWLALR